MTYYKGTVKWFNNPKGIGFIEPLPESEYQDILIHYSTIVMDGFKTLKAGEIVKFKFSKGEKGYHTTEVIPEERRKIKETHVHVDSHTSSPQPIAEEDS
ncbi:Cold shock-like protein CspD [invertebrate metagenome]|uniref:Cold shock-like protein CspD n=1 Tax=invertebrate metagenome TaxID=1711999 RepID=A0A2H9T8J6_9ZZZZ